jgi:hypothetical protein
MRVIAALRRPGTRSWGALAIALTFLGAGCGSEGDTSGAATEATATTTVTVAQPTTPSLDAIDPPIATNEVPGDGVAFPDPASDGRGRLILLAAGNETALRAAVDARGGTVVAVVAETGTYRVDFPVDTDEALLALRDELRAEGIDAQLALEPQPAPVAAGG